MPERADHIVVTAACLVVLATPLAAQQIDDPRVTVGARVRVEKSEIQQVGAPRPVTFAGRVAALRGDTLFLETRRAAAPRPFMLATVDRLWVSQGTGGRRTLRGLAIGTIVGGGVLAAIAASASSCEGPSGSLACPDPGSMAAVGFGAGAIAGAVIGGLIGFNTRAERWERVR